MASISPPPRVTTTRAAGAKPPTSPLRRRGRSNKESESDIFAIISNVEVKGKTVLIQCSHLWYLNMVEIVEVGKF